MPSPDVKSRMEDATRMDTIHNKGRVSKVSNGLTKGIYFMFRESEALWVPEYKCRGATVVPTVMSVLQRTAYFFLVGKCT